ncbi:muscle M-line assembly protein unc-89-like [Dorcoceras hygrometricum]|uniref:Muscle M-line assembly protein unc-89-like n=1 Tax=Dorcoceras hygrometricum TaxID=472368 RepID=A0A2Z7BMH6_9LAMI|nr:muscle M-line assembly protein unc-89-like [Dorcoceras hygrometricum]
MSRCFPYPPPGFTLSRSSEDALIESIKFQKERKRAKEEKKRGKEKKERRKEKDKKRKVRNENANQNKDKYDISKGQCGKNFWANSEHLEKSGLTEEHDQPKGLRVPSTSSDSTENSTKKKRDFSYVDGGRGHGNIITIRMASKKQCFPNSANDELLCSTSGSTGIPAQDKNEIGHKSKRESIYIPTEETRKFGRGFIAGTKKELICLISGNDAGASGITETSSVHDAVGSSTQKGELKYNKLIQAWLPPQLEDKCLKADDLDWLFNGKNQGNGVEKRLKSECDGLSCSSSSTLWHPHARFLPEVDVHALPYTVPFA